MGSWIIQLSGELQDRTNDIDLPTLGRGAMEQRPTGTQVRADCRFGPVQSLRGKVAVR